MNRNALSLRDLVSSVMELYVAGHKRYVSYGAAKKEGCKLELLAENDIYLVIKYKHLETNERTLE